MNQNLSFAFALAGTLLAASALGGDGVPPRTSASSYPAHADAASALIGAAQVTPAQLAKTFPALLSKNYVVLEIAVYPKDGAAVDVGIFDFVLQAGAVGEIRADPAEEVAGMWRPGYKPPPPDGKVHVTNDVGVVYTNGRDPVTGRRQSGVGTYEGTTVSNGPDPRQAPPPDRSDADRNAKEIEAKLRQKELPEGSTRDPVAGYLYFAKPARMPKDAKLVLTYTKDGKTVQVGPAF
jgi:hypothetical protein